MIMLGKTLTGRYKIVKQLGGGGFSHTFIAEDGYLPDRPTCVIKQLKPASSQEEVLRISRELFDNEAKVLYRLGKHDCIPALLAHFEEDEEFFLAQELIEGDVLTQEIKSGACLGEQYTIDFLIDILPTLDFVHRQQVIHRDIKPSNLIRRASDRKIVLIDFGAVKEVSTQPISQIGHTSSLVIGSPGYMPNEQCGGKTVFASDIYAIGIIAIQALTGLLPSQIPEDPLTSEFCWRDRAKTTPTLADVIDKMVCSDFRQRYQSAKDVLDALQPLLRRSLAQTVFSQVAPIPFEELPITPDYSTAQSIAQSITQSKSIVDILAEILIEEVSDDLEMSEDPVRAKKLVCLVCTGILENDLNNLNNFSFIELLQDLYQQYSTIEALKESLVKAVKTIAVPKQRQYLMVAKVVFTAASKLYKQSVAELAEPKSAPQSNLSSQSANLPSSYAVSHLVINAGSAQLIAPFNNLQDHSPNTISKESFNEILDNEILSECSVESNADSRSLVDDYPDAESDIFAWVAHDIDTDAQQMRLKKLLFYTYQDVWESDLRQLNSVDWVELLRELVSFIPTFSSLMALIEGAVQRVSKPTEYVAIANLLISKLAYLYPDCPHISNDLEAIAPNPLTASPEPIVGSDVQADHKVPFDPIIASNLFDLRLELMRFTNSMRAKILLFSTLYYPFNPDRDNWHDLKKHQLDELLRQLFYAYATFDQAEKSVNNMARSLSEPSAYEQSASYVLQAVKVIYDRLKSQSMRHPAENSSRSSEDTDFTQASAIASNSDNEDTCQFG